MSISVKFSKNFDFSQIFEKIWNLVKFRINLIFFDNFSNFQFSHIFHNFGFGQIFRKNFDFGQILRKFPKISNLFKMSKIFDFVPNFQNMSILEKIFGKIRFWSKFSNNSDCFEDFLL